MWQSVFVIAGISTSKPSSSAGFSLFLQKSTPNQDTNAFRDPLGLAKAAFSSSSFDSFEQIVPSISLLHTLENADHAQASCTESLKPSR